jgi:hypothetical protein
VTAEAGRGLDAAAGDAVADTLLAQRGVAVGDVVGLVGVDFRRFAAARATPRPDLRDALNQRFEGLGVVEVRSRDGEGKR